MSAATVNEVVYWPDGTATVFFTRLDRPKRLGALTVEEPPPGMEAMAGIRLEGRGGKIYVAGKHFADRVGRARIRLVPRPEAAKRCGA